MKRIIIFLLLLTVLFCFISCGRQPRDTRIDIVCTAYAQYDWVKELSKGAEDRFNITLLTSGGADIHSYQPTAEDMVIIDRCELIIYIGSNSDGWTADMINGDTDSLNMTEYLSKDGCEDEEHIWLSLGYAKEICNAIFDKLCWIDPDNRELYRENLKRYINELTVLDSEYRSVTENAELDTLIFADRFPFACMAKDYGLTCYALYDGCGAESEASFEKKINLVNKLDSLGLPCVIILENSSSQPAESIVSETRTKDQSILVMNSMQSSCEGSYIDIMKENLKTLKTALRG